MSIICVSIFYVLTIVLGLTETLIAFDNEDDPCQHGKYEGLTLSDWLKIAGLTRCGVVGIGLIFWFCALLTTLCFQKSTCTGRTILGLSVTVATMHVADMLFSVCWTALGIVILATNENNSCITDMNDLGNAAIAAVTLNHAVAVVGLRIMMGSVA